MTDTSNPARLGHSLLGQLVAFEATARLGSFRAAADELHITTGAVAQQVRLMEQKLGMEVFKRLPRGTRVLPEAEGFLSKVQLALDLVNDATRELTALRSPKVGRPLTLSTTGAFASRWLIPKLARLSEAEPGLSVMIDASNAARPLHGADAVNMAIRWGAPPFPGCHAHLLHIGTAIAVCAPAVKKAHRWQTLNDLADGAPLVSDSHDNWVRWFALRKLPMTSTSQMFSQTSLAIEAAERGLGVALAPEVLVADALETGALVRALDSEECLETDAGFYLLTATEPDPASDLGKMVRWLLHDAA
ncbi:LysR substrate-binding domain-containing protein [Pseudomonas sp. NPDC090202]|uniref:LysR substrate-binding domain-containing protein n=1 Tax=unclassified Pseudomonas TaxID=196821 RepID=UPI0037FF8433